MLLLRLRPLSVDEFQHPELLLGDSALLLPVAEAAAYSLGTAKTRLAPRVPREPYTNSRSNASRVRALICVSCAVMG